MHLDFTESEDKLEAFAIIMEEACYTTEAYIVMEVINVFLSHHMELPHTTKEGNLKVLKDISQSLSYYIEAGINLDNNHLCFSLQIAAS